MVFFLRNMNFIVKKIRKKRFYEIYFIESNFIDLVTIRTGV